MGEFCDGKGFHVLVWKNFVLVRVIRFWYGRILLLYATSGSDMEEFCYGTSYQILVWKNFVMISVIRFLYRRIL